jgi:hypothetical protein
MSSPLVAGVVCTLRERYPTYTNVQIIAALLKLTTTLPKTITNDVDCQGVIPNVRFLQTLVTENQISGLFVPFLYLDGPNLNYDYLTW